MDPMIAGTAEVKGDIRLRFRTAKNRVVIAKKVLMVSKKQKEIDYLLEAKIIEIKNGKIYSLDFFLADEAAVRLS